MKIIVIDSDGFHTLLVGIRRVYIITDRRQHYNSYGTRRSLRRRRPSGRL